VRREYYTSLLKELRRRPEVVAAGAIDQNALTGGATFWSVKTDAGVPFDGPQRTVSPGYFEAMGVHPLAGRLLEETDRATGEAVVINATAAERYFAGGAIGHTARTQGKDSRLWRIVGVVPNIRHGSPQFRIRPEMYILAAPDAESASGALAVIMRLRAGASLSLNRLKQISEGLGPRVIVGRARPATALVGQQIATPKHRMLLLTLLGLFGLLLTLVGIFSTTAYAVARRTREIGVRVAFGARPAQVVTVMIRDAIWPVVFGLGAGLASTYYTARMISSFLFQTPPDDPMTLAAAVISLGLAAIFAAWVPARRAATVDPVVALRAE
jgi:hypothetical protein